MTHHQNFQLQDFLNGVFAEKRGNWQLWQSQILEPITTALARNELPQSIEIEGTSYSARSVIILIASYLGSESFANDIDPRLLKITGKTNAFAPVSDYVNSKRPIWSDPQKPGELLQFFTAVTDAINAALQQVVRTEVPITTDSQEVIAALSRHRPLLTEIWNRFTKAWDIPKKIVLRDEIELALQDLKRQANQQNDDIAKNNVRQAETAVNDHNTKFHDDFSKKRQDEKTQLDRALDKSSFIHSAIEQFEQLDQAGFSVWYASLESHLIEKYGDLHQIILNVDSWIDSLLQIFRKWLDQLENENKTKIKTATDNLNNFLADTLQITLSDITPVEPGGEGDTTAPEEAKTTSVAADITKLQRTALAKLNLISDKDLRLNYERDLAIKWAEVISEFIQRVNLGSLTEVVDFLQQTLAAESTTTMPTDWTALLARLRQILLELPLPDEIPTSVVVKQEDVEQPEVAETLPGASPTPLSSPTDKWSVQDLGEVTRLQSLLVLQAENQITQQLIEFYKNQYQRELTRQEIDNILNQYHADLTDIVWLQLVGHGGLHNRLPAAQLADVWVTASGVLLPRILSELPGQNRPSFDLTPLSRFATDQEINTTQQLLIRSGIDDWQKTTALLQSLHHNGQRLDELVLLAQNLLSQDSNSLQEILTQLVATQSGFDTSDSRVVNYVNTILATLMSVQENGIDLSLLPNLSRTDRSRLVLLLQKMNQGGQPLSDSEMQLLTTLLQGALPVLKTLQNLTPEQLNLIFARLIGAQEILQFHELRTQVNGQLQQMSDQGIKIPFGAFRIAAPVLGTVDSPQGGNADLESAPHGRGDSRLKISLAISNQFLEQARKEGLGLTVQQIEQYNLYMSVMVGEIVYGVPPTTASGQPLLITPQQWLIASNFADPEVETFESDPNFAERYASVAQHSYDAGIQTRRAGSAAQVQKLQQMMATVQKIRQMKMLFAAGTGGTGLILLALADPKIRKKILQAGLFGAVINVGIIFGSLLALLKSLQLAWAVAKAATRVLFDFATFPIRSTLGLIGNQITGAANLIGLGNELSLGTAVVKGLAGVATNPLEQIWTGAKAAGTSLGKSTISKFINQSYNAGNVAGQTLHAITYADIFGPIVTAGLIVPFAFATIMTIIVMTVIGASLNDLPRDVFQGENALGMLNTTDMACISIDESSFSGSTDKLQQQVVKLMQNPYARQVCSFTGDITMRYMGTSTGFCRSFVGSYGCVEGNTVYVGDAWVSSSEAIGVFTLGHEIIHILQHTSDVITQQQQSVGISTIPTYSVCDRYGMSTEHQAEAFALTFYTDIYPNSNNAYACEPSCGGGILRCQFNIRSMPNIVDFVHQYLQP